MDQETQRRLDKLEPMVSDIQQRVAALETQDAVADVHRQNVDTRLKSIEDNLKWLVRLIVGSIVAAFIAFLIKGGLNIG